MRTETHGTGCLIDDYSFILLSILPPYIGGWSFWTFGPQPPKFIIQYLEYL
jgi:hypothetical protein